MIKKHIAQKLAHRIMDQLGYNINIMNDKGIIIASGDASRVGNFHEVAWRIVNERLDTQVIHPDERDYIGVKPGVNMPLVFNDEYIGVVGITGDPRQVHHFAALGKMSVETMLEYELYKETGRQRQNTRDALANVLLHVEPFSPQRAVALAGELDYRCDVVRLPLVFKAEGVESAALVQVITTSPHFGHQDMAFRDWNHVVVFKCLPEAEIPHFRSYVAPFIEGVGNRVGRLSCCTGSLQCDLAKYRVAWRHALWLGKHLGRDFTGTAHFMDHVLTWFLDKVSFSHFDSVFAVYSRNVDKMEPEVFIETVTALCANNMNLKASARQLHMHRNSMQFRLNKIRDLLNIDPVNNSSDRDIIALLLHYMQRKGSG